MISHNFNQRSPEWYAVRAGKITGSNFHTLFGSGETKQTLIYSKASELITGKPCESTYMSADMQRGVDLEDSAVFAYELEREVICEKVGFIEYNKYFGCSPDGLIGDDGLIEVKCPNDANFLKLVTGKNISPTYITQMQVALYITGRDWCDFVAFNVNYPLYVQRITPDEDMFAKIETALSEYTEEVNKIVEAYGKYKFEPNKTEIRKAIKEGKEISGASLIEKENLTVK